MLLNLIECIIIHHIKKRDLTLRRIQNEIH
nr:MAG TPA: hypothetical protein [Myoviridae sp. ctTS62]